MTQAQPLKNSIQFLLILLIFIGLLATTIISGVSWWTSQNLAQSIEALGKHSKVLAAGNVAISHTIANYLDRQDRIVSAKTLAKLKALEDKSTFKTDFDQQYQALVNDLSGFEIREAHSLKSAFVQFDQFDDRLFSFKQKILQLAITVSLHTENVIAMTDRTRTYANSLASKVKAYEQEKAKVSPPLDEEKEGLNLFRLLFTDKKAANHMADKKTVSRISAALVDKNREGNVTKSLISLHISELERAAQKMRLTTDYLTLEAIKSSEVMPELERLNAKLDKIKNIKMTLEDYDSVIAALSNDIAQLSQELTGETDSLYASKHRLIMQSDQFELFKQALDQSRSELLMSLEQLSQSGDRLADSTKNNVTDVVNNSRHYTVGIGVSVLLMFLIVGQAIAQRINAMAKKIKLQADQMAKANEVITKAHHELQESNELMTDSIGYASKIQRAIQSSEQEFSHFCQDAFVIWQPRDIVGGDMYWVRVWGQGHLILFADCTGHGVPGAFMTILTKAALDKALRSVTPGHTGKLITAIHQIVQADLGQEGDDSMADDGLDLGVCYIPNHKRRLTFSGARLSMIYRTDTGVKEIKGEKHSIGYRGIAADITFTEHQLDLSQETRCYLFTDGMIDQVGGDKTLSFGRRRLFKLIDDVAEQSMSNQATVFLNALQRYQGTENRRDDVTMIGFTLMPDTADSQTREINIEQS